MIILSGTTSETARFYDSLIRKHGPHPFLLVGFARIIRYLGSPGTAIDLYHQASIQISPNTRFLSSDLVSDSY